MKFDIIVTATLLFVQNVLSYDYQLHHGSYNQLYPAAQSHSKYQARQHQQYQHSNRGSHPKQYPQAHHTHHESKQYPQAHHTHHESKQYPQAHHTHHESKQYPQAHQTHPKQYSQTHRTHPKQYPQTHRTHPKQYPQTHRTHPKQYPPTHQTHHEPKQYAQSHQTHPKQYQTQQYLPTPQYHSNYDSRPYSVGMCPRIYSPINGQVSMSGLYHGAVAKYTCQYGYEIAPIISVVRYCVYGKWSGKKPICTPMRQTVRNSFQMAEQDSQMKSQNSFQFRGQETRQPNAAQSTKMAGNAMQLMPKVPFQMRRLPNTCPAVLPQRNGFVTLGENPTLIAAYRCFPGYSLYPDKGNGIRKCLPNGQWSGVIPVCKRDPVKCDSLDIPINGACKYNTILEGGIFECKCCQNCQLIGSSVRICMPNGNWSGIVPVCIPNVMCKKLYNPSNGLVQLTSNKGGAIATYSCNQQYSLSGYTSRICQANGLWSGAEPSCTSKINKVSDVKCQSLYHPINGLVTLSNTTSVGSVAMYSCGRGYKLNGNKTRICQSDGLWSDSAIIPVCQKQNCKRLPNPPNGQVFYKHTTLNPIALYKCNRGYHLVGKPNRRCQNNFLWSGQMPECQMIFGDKYFCPRLPSPKHGNVEITGLVAGSTASFSCNSREYYLAVGDNVRKCLKTGVWSGVQPQCNKKNVHEEMNYFDTDSN